MMRQMPPAHPLLEPVRGMRKMNPVVNHLIENEPTDESIKRKNTRRITENRSRRKCNRCHRYPRADSEHRMRIPMMNRVQRSSESAEPMPEPSVNRILNESPGQDPAGKQEKTHEHGIKFIRARK